MELGVRREAELPHLVREPAGEPEGAIVLLHGRAHRRGRPASR